MANEIRKYDVEIADPNSNRSFGYMLDYTAPPDPGFASKDEVPPRLMYSAGMPSAVYPYSARDTTPPHPIEFSSWVGGAGQWSIDPDTSSPYAFYESANVDPTQTGVLTMAPGQALWSTPGITNLCIVASQNCLDDDGNQIVTLWAVFNDTEGSPTQLKRWNNDPGSAHYQTWEASVWANSTIQTESESFAIQALCTDGELVYFSTAPLDITTPDGGGNVYVGVAAGDDTSGKFGRYCALAVGNIIELAFCGGVLYAVQSFPNSLTGHQDLIAGFIIDDLHGAPKGLGQEGTDFWYLSGSAYLFPNIQSAGLVASDVNVFWAVAGAEKSFVYVMQWSGDKANSQSANVFQLAATFPTGFRATCCSAYLENIYVGGWSDTGVLYATDPNQTRKQGRVYALINTSAAGAQSSKVLAQFKCDADSRFPDADNRVLGIRAFDKFVYILTGENLYLYDLETGGYSHYMDIPAVTPVKETDTPPSYSANSWPQAVPTVIPSVDGWSRSSASTGFKAKMVAGWLSLTAAKKKEEFYYRRGLSGGPATMEVVVESLSLGHSAQFGINDGVCCAVVLMEATKTGYEFSLGYMRGNSYAWITSVKKKAAHTITVIMDGTNAAAIPGVTKGAKLYIDNAAALTPIVKHHKTAQHAASANTGGEPLQVAYDSLPPTTDSWRAPQTVYFGVGTPGISMAEDTVAPAVRYQYVKYVDGAAEVPLSSAPETITIGRQGFGIVNGAVTIPLPSATQGQTLYADPNTQASSGFLTASRTTIRTGTRLKKFAFIDVVHEPLLPGQSITLDAYVDWRPTGGSTRTMTVSGDDDPVNVLHKLNVSLEGQELFWTITLSDPDNPDRAVDDRITVRNVTSYFSTLPVGPTWTFVFMVSNRAQMRNKMPYDEACDKAMKFLYDMEGEDVQITGDYGSFSGYIDSVKESGIPIDDTGGGFARGRMTVNIKEIDT